jgi:hypothetical protein
VIYKNSKRKYVPQERSRVRLLENCGVLVFDDFSGRMFHRKIKALGKEKGQAA